MSQSDSEPAALASTGNEIHIRRLPATVVLTGLTCFAYSAIFAYDSGWLRYHQLPLHFADLSLQRLFVVLSAMGGLVGFVLFAVTMIPVGIRKVLPGIVLILMASFFTLIYVLAVAKEPWSWGLVLGTGALACTLLSTLIISIIRGWGKGATAWFKGSESTVATPSHNPDHDSLYDRFLQHAGQLGMSPRVLAALIAVVAQLLFSAHSSGTVDARNPGRLLVSQADPSILLLRVTGSTAILGRRSLKGDTLINAYRIVPIEDINTVEWRSERIRFVNAVPK